MQLMKRVTGAGLAVMATVALTTAIWPTLAALVTGLLLTVLGAVAATLVALAVRWVRGELAWRRELRTLPPVDAPTYGATHGPAYGAAGPTPEPAWLREPA